MSNYYTSVRIQKALTVKLTAYAAGQVCGGLNEIDLGINRSCGGYMDRIHLVDDDNIKAAMDVYLFDGGLPTTFADGVAFAPTVDDLKKMCDFALLGSGDYTTLNGSAVGRLTFNKSSGFKFKTPTGKVYLYLVPTGTPTFLTAAALTLVSWAIVEV